MTVAVFVSPLAGSPFTTDHFTLPVLASSAMALDAKTGKVKWSVVNGDPAKGETNTATVTQIRCERHQNARQSGCSDVAVQLS